MSGSARRAALLVALVCAGLLVAYATPLRSMLETWLHSTEGPRTLGWMAPVVFLAVSTLAIAAGVPRLFFAAVAGALFGFAGGSVLAQMGAVGGCLLTFGVGRALGREWVESRFADREHRVRRLLDLAERHGVVANLLIRSAPVGNFFVTNVLMSVSRIGLRDMLTGTIIGTLPGTIAFAMVGSGVSSGVSSHVLLGAFLLVAWGVIYTRYLVPRLNRSLDRSA